MSKLAGNWRERGFRLRLETESRCSLCKKWILPSQHVCRECMRKETNDTQIYASLPEITAVRELAAK